MIFSTYVAEADEEVAQCDMDMTEGEGDEWYKWARGSGGGGGGGVALLSKNK